MATYTEHYKLHQWVPEDHFLRADFNQDFQKIDAALGEKCQIKAGAYVGDGAETRDFDLGFTPAAVLSFNEWGQSYCSPGYYGGLAVSGMPVKGDSYETGKVDLVTIVDGGFRVRHKEPSSGGGGYVYANLPGLGYRYIAFR